MNREKFAEDAYLYLLNELKAADRVEFENILMQDDLLNREFQIIKNDFSLFVRCKPEDVDDKVLTSARHDLMRKVKQEAEHRSFISGMVNSIKDFFHHNYSLAFGGIATFVLGIGIGYMLLVSKNVQPLLKLDNPIEIQSESKQPANQVQDSQEANTQQVSQLGNENVEQANKLEPGSEYVPKPNFRESLINTLLGNSNPGIRIRSISNISNQAQKGSLRMDPRIKDALLTAMMKDKNPVVRKEAMTVLTRYPFDEKFRDALLYVLSNDSNSGNRVTAINMLTNLREQGMEMNPIMKQTLTKKSITDNNTFVKIRAASILKEDE